MGALISCIYANNIQNKAEINKKEENKQTNKYYKIIKIVN